MTDKQKLDLIKDTHITFLANLKSYLHNSNNFTDISYYFDKDNNENYLNDILKLVCGVERYNIEIEQILTESLTAALYQKKKNSKAPYLLQPTQEIDTSTTTTP